MTRLGVFFVTDTIDGMVICVTQGGNRVGDKRVDFAYDAIA
ncbi:MAG: hypothetical protein ACFB12_16130 [Leptolyngbyaceae cyanobacterium]